MVNENFASKIAKDIVSLASYLHEGVGVWSVVIGQLLLRLPYAACINFIGSYRLIGFYENWHLG